MRAALLAASLAAGSASAPLPTVTLRVPNALPPHPRLLANASQFAALREAINSDPTGPLGALYNAVLSGATAAAQTGLTPYLNCTVVGACRNAALFGAGANYIDTGHMADVLLGCGVMHQLNLTTGPNATTTWAQRGVQELLHLTSDSEFPSWYWPVGQALERSAAAYAVAVGYDLFYDVLTPGQRQTVEAAISARVFDSRARDQRQGMWWTADPLNWAINAQAPLIAAALAVADVPALAPGAQATLDILQASLPAPLASWAPYGIWPESPSYLSFTFGSQVQGAAALLAATGSDGGLLSAPGVCGVGLANIYHTGPSAQLFNWGDAHAGAPATPAMFYAADWCAQPAYAAFARALHGIESSAPGAARDPDHARRSMREAAARLGKLSVAAASGSASTSALDLLWYSALGSWADVAALPLAAVFADPSPDMLRGRKTHYGSFRSCWAFGGVGSGAGGCPSPAWVAFKGGQNFFDDHGSGSHNNHGHLDVGSFVLESGPESFRWAVDLGPDAYDYPLLAYFGRFRFGYHFVSSEGHNTLSFDTDEQHRKGSGAIVASNTSCFPAPGCDAWATVDTTTAHGGAVVSLRTFTMAAAAPHAVTIADTWQHPSAQQATFTLHTTATVALNGSTAVLTSPTGLSSLRLDAALPGAAGTAGVTPLWASTVLAVAPPQATTYDGAAVNVVTVTVPAAVGALTVTLTPLN